VQHWLFWWRPPCLLETVIVNLKDDPTTALRGVLWRSHGAWFVLRQPVALNLSAPDPAKREVALPGEVVIHRDNVSFFQVVQP
jgi:hypothetical protein